MRRSTPYAAQTGIDDFDKAALERAFMFAPDWGRGNLADTKKWKDMQAFLNADTFNQGYRLIEPVSA